MKRTWVVLMLVVAMCLLVAVPLVLGSCGASDGGDEEAILGTWTDASGIVEYEFKSGGALVMRAMGEEIETEYTMADGKLSLKDPESGEPLEADYTLDGDTLTITAEGESDTLTRKK